MSRTERAQGGLRRWMGLALIAVMVFGAMAGGAAAHRDEDHGEVTIHDEPEGPPSDDIECEFWVKGHHMTSQQGEVWLSHQQADFSTRKHLGDYEGVLNKDGNYEFMEGPFNYSEGWGHHYVTAVTDPRENRSDEIHLTNSTEMNYVPCPDDHEQPPEDEAQPPACPEDLRAQAHANENVGLSWNASADADSYHVYRATGDGDFEHVAEVNGTSFTDQGTEADTTYRYEVTAANGAGGAEACGTVEVTAIPFFGSPAIVAMAALGSVVAVAAVRARRG